METRFAAILLMGGEGRRLGQSIPKQFHLLGKKKVYQHTLETFAVSGIFQQIVLVCHPNWVATVQKEIVSASYHIVPHVIPGGATRQASSLLGIQACDPPPQFVMIHDAVRPFVSLEILERNKASVLQHLAVDTCIASTDTLVHSPTGNWVCSIPPRREYLRGQTPQSFAFPLILQAHLTTQQTAATDDCSLIGEIGHPIAVVKGEEDNIKITTETDLELAACILHRRSRSS